MAVGYARYHVIVIGSGSAAALRPPGLRRRATGLSRLGCGE
jgi:hypothetical protein